MNAIEVQMTVISLPVVQIKMDHIHASVTMVIKEMDLNAVLRVILPVL